MPAPTADPDQDEKPVKALDEDDIALLKTYGLGPYVQRIKNAEVGVKDVAKRVNDIAGVKESDTGLAPPSRWDLVSDKQAMQEEQPLQVLLRIGTWMYLTIEMQLCFPCKATPRHWASMLAGVECVL